MDIFLTIQVNQPTLLAFIFSQRTPLQMTFHIVAEDTLRRDLILLLIMRTYPMFLAIKGAAVALLRARIEVCDCILVQHLLLTLALLIVAFKFQALEVLHGETFQRLVILLLKLL